MKKYDLIVFDLIDTLAYCKGLPEYSIHIEKVFGKEIIDTFIDGGNIDTLKSVEEAITKWKSIIHLDASQEEMIRKWLSWSESYLFDDSIEILEYLKSEGYKTAVISNSPPTPQNQLLDLGISQYIDEAIFSFEVGSRKPEKEIFVELLLRAEVAPTHALMIGDSIKNDVNGARAVGLDAVLLDRNNTMDFDPKITNLLQLRDFLSLI